jgi:hypothetical protein
VAIPQHTGFQIKYSGPDTEDKLIALPHHRLFRVLKDNTLGEGIAGLSTVATAFLNELPTPASHGARHCRRVP